MRGHIEIFENIHGSVLIARQMRLNNLPDSRRTTKDRIGPEVVYDLLGLKRLVTDFVSILSYTSINDDFLHGIVKAKLHLVRDSQCNEKADEMVTFLGRGK